MLIRVKVILPSNPTTADSIRHCIDIGRKGIGFPPIDEDLFRCRLVITKQGHHKFKLRRPTLKEALLQDEHTLLVVGNTWAEHVETLHADSDRDICVKGRTTMIKGVPAEVAILPPGASVRIFKETVPEGWYLIRAMWTNSPNKDLRLVCTDVDRLITPYFKKRG